MLKELRAEIKRKADKERAKNLQRFFKTGKGDYGEGDVFVGLTVPIQRGISKEFGKDLSLEDIQILLDSKIHEERLIGLFVLISKYKKLKEKDEKREIFDFYLNNVKKGNVNNWDLVDLSAPNIVGDFLTDKKAERKILHTLSKSAKLWEKRVSILACFAFIRNKDFEDALKLSEVLLKDKHDLIHKAVGWMLREIGKKDKEVLVNFLEEHYRKMPRTALRYSIEKFGEGERRAWLGKL